ncbi:MAG: alpha/beta fold hydrolase [Bacilli bacterium]|jgi:pimeloyl-ACP methyl ester carboxylesterase
MKITIDDHIINYETYGNEHAQTVVILHGWGASLEYFNLISQYLAVKYKVYAIDLPGFGKSSIPPKPLSIIDYAQIIKSFLDHFNITEPILIGHSFGGRIIITLTGHLKYQADKIILINSAGIKPKRTIWYYIKIYTYKFLKLFQKFMPKKMALKYIIFLRNIFGSKDYNNVNEIMKRTLILAVNTDLKAYLKEIAAPTLLIWGDNDQITPIKDGIMMQKLIPDAGLVILKDAGHHAYLEKYYEFRMILASFLNNEA